MTIVYISSDHCVRLLVSSVPLATPTYHFRRQGKQTARSAVFSSDLDHRRARVRPRVSSTVGV